MKLALAALGLSLVGLAAPARAEEPAVLPGPLLGVSVGGGPVAYGDAGVRGTPSAELRLGYGLTDHLSLSLSASAGGVAYPGDNQPLGSKPFGAIVSYLLGADATYFPWAWSGGGIFLRAGAGLDFGAPGGSFGSAAGPAILGAVGSSFTLGSRWKLEPSIYYRESHLGGSFNSGVLRQGGVQLGFVFG